MINHRIVQCGLILLVVINCSCGDKGKLDVQRYENGIVKSEIFLLKDSVKHGKAKFYYSNGNLKGVLNYSNDMREGLAMYYYSNGNPEGQVEYKNDTIDGFAKWFHVNGKLKSATYWLNGNEYGSGYFYDENGNLRTYQCVDFLGDAIYVLKLNEHGYRIREEGAVFSHNFNTLPPDTSKLRTGMPVTFYITVAEPPGYTTEVEVRSIDVDGITHIVGHSIENSTILITKTFDKPGRHKLVILGEIRDQGSSLMLSDSIAFNINVRP